jgi:FkbM family methyltransferase
MLFARKRWYPVNKLLFNLSLRGIGVLNDEFAPRYTGELPLLRTLAAQWTRGPVVFDVGANVGEYARMVLEVAPTAALYAFEPHKQTFANPQSAAQRVGYAAFNVGCGDREALRTLYDYQGADGSPHASLYREVIETLHRGDALIHEVRMIALDDFVREHGIARVDLIKIDTEGHELAVLSGLRHAIAAGAVDVIQFEFNSMNVISRSFFRDFCTALPDYTFYRMLPDGGVPLGQYSPTLYEIFAFQNIVALRTASSIRL